MEIEACDACDVLDDDAAKAHIAVCRDCQQKLGKHVIDMLTEYRCFGVWPVFGDVHELPEIPHNPDNPGEYPEWWKKQNP